jgi:glycolate oxidase
MKFAGERHSRILDFLERIVGKSLITDRIEERYYYSSDASAEEPCIPEFVVMPGTVEEIQEIIRLANREKISVTPRIGGLTLWRYLTVEAYCWI